jgi:inorganic triphosphatase YgiF
MNSVKNLTRATKIEACEEPEIQYAATPELFKEIHAWLESRGRNVHKTSPEPEVDVATYYDTKNYRLLREGIEYRIKDKGNTLRHDMKLPFDTRNREVLPDQNDILWRNELKFKTKESKPSLMVFWGQALLNPVKKRLKTNFFDKELVEQFRSIFQKEKIDHTAHCGSRIEYSFQKGRMETTDGKKSTPELYILELELRTGSLEGLLQEKQELEAEFGPKGLKILPMRKVVMGFELLEDQMSVKQFTSFRDAKIRNSRAYAAAVEEAGFAQKMAA